ncbi:MAG: YdcH family protein [Acetobacter sp.]|nr:YdcH family protein [Acetobacter sp.]MCH4062390.1 YdcH family protein [Acetobacter sp.]MCH4088763.1 YdcH family protein [Acetobacter sp.]MCI1292668.1 YdcH family protein [Acetobacter sp.]MCI1319232.1 YdcH family protein [Acetobacter sp.]
MPTLARIESLSRRHSHIDRRIADEELRPLPDQRVLMSLKLQKLRIKEEIDRLRSV